MRVERTRECLKDRIYRDFIFYSGQKVRNSRKIVKEYRIKKRKGIPHPYLAY